MVIKLFPSFKRFLVSMLLFCLSINYCLTNQVLTTHFFWKPSINTYQDCMNVNIFKSTQTHLVKFSHIITSLLPTLEYVYIFKHFSSLKNIPSLAFFVIQYLLSSYFPKPYIFSRQWQSRYKTKKHQNQNSLIYQKPMKYMNHNYLKL